MKGSGSIRRAVWKQTDESDEAEARWQLWMECYEIKVLFDNHWLLSAGCDEEGI